jgi:hypothetical protein
MPKKYKLKNISRAEFKRKVSSGMKKKWKDKEYRKKVVSSIKNKYKTDYSYREKISIAMKKVFKDHPNLAVNLRKNFINYLRKNPKVCMNILNGKGNPNKPDVKCLDKRYVRSIMEKKVGDFLFLNKIKYKYESKLIIFKKELKWAVPDFYLPYFSCYIEVCGDYPGSMTKVRWKKKMYKKHGLKCIFLTSQKMINLKKYLLDKLK